MLKTIRISPDVPVAIAFAALTPRLVAHRPGRGNEFQAIFDTTDGRCVSLPRVDAAVIEQKLLMLGIAARQRFLLVLETRYQGGERVRKWEIYHVPAGATAVGEQPNGTFVVPSQPGASAPAPVLRQSSAAPWVPGATMRISELQKAFALAHKYAQDPSVPAAQQAQFREIRKMLWEAGK